MDGDGSNFSDQPFLFKVAGVDLREFAEGWLSGLERDDAPARGLLEHAADHYDFGAHFMMANIGPDATRDDARPEQLLLYGVLAAYQNDGFPGSAHWASPRAHLERALDHVRGMGDTAAAHNLLMSVVKRSAHERREWFPRRARGPLDDEASRIAAHDQDMASIEMRNVRAAALLDPAVSIDEMLFGES